MLLLRLGKRTQGTLLAAYTAVVLALTLLVEGRAGVRTNLDPFEDTRRLAAMARQGALLSNRFVYALLGIAGNLALFSVWGFLAFKLLHERGARAWRTHAGAVLSGTLLSVSVETVQLFLPTRAADVNDVFWNVVGAMVGSLAAHAHANVTVEWE